MAELTKLTREMLSTGIAEVAPTAAKSRLACFNRGELTNDMGPTVFYACLNGDKRYVERWDNSLFTQRWQVESFSWEEVQAVFALSIGLRTQVGK